jgi:DNA-binding transcriptional ArsR family regulator
MATAVRNERDHPGERTVAAAGVATPSASQFRPLRAAGTPLLGQLLAYLKSLGLEPITGKPYKPTTKGKRERLSILILLKSTDLAMQEVRTPHTSFYRSVKRRYAARPRRGRRSELVSIQSSLYSQCMLTVAPRLDVMSRLGRALADPTRARILISLLDGPGYPAELARDLELTRSNVSNHLTCLRGCGIVVAMPEGRQTRYEVADPHLVRALSDLMNVVLAVDEGAPCHDNTCTVPGCCD